MQRDIGALSNRHYDLLVVGGGIHGAWIAWDAALRGLTVALIERGDFGQATSANSLKTIHGGLRYFRDGDLGLVRRMIRERLALLRVAPHLVEPLPCLMPTYGSLTRGRQAMAIALRLNDLFGYDRNCHGDPDRSLPNGRILSPEAALQLAPGLPREGLTGAALWYDAQMYSSERLTLAVVRSAAQAGAVVANYVQAGKLRSEGGRVVGVQAHDQLTHSAIEIRARLVVNAAGPWASELLGQIAGVKRPPMRLSTAMNLVTRQIIPGTAVGVPSRAGGAARSRMLFIAPWRGYSLIGTAHEPYTGHPDADQVAEHAITQFLDDVNSAYPAAQLGSQDVLTIQRGLLPAVATGATEQVKLLRRGHVYDHGREDGVEGLITAIGVKYTTARYVAEQVVDRALLKLARRAQPCTTHETPLFGGAIKRIADFSAQAVERQPAGLAPETVRTLVRNYGTAYPQVLAYLEAQHELATPVSAAPPVLGAEVLYAVREEMAQTLGDVVLRRLGVGATGRLEPAYVDACADLMACELGWSVGRRAHELQSLNLTIPPGSEPLVAREAGGSRQLVLSQ
jgi:glycerol-3-phosphate dehydrogenase